MKIRTTTAPGRGITITLAPGDTLIDLDGAGGELLDVIMTVGAFRIAEAARLPVRWCGFIWHPGGTIEDPETGRTLNCGGRRRRRT